MEQLNNCLIVVQTNFDKAKEQVGKGDYAAVLIFHPGFEDSVNTGKEMPVESLYDQARGLSTLIILINVRHWRKYDSPFFNASDNEEDRCIQCKLLGDSRKQ